MEEDDDSRIQRLHLRVQGNCITNNNMPIPFYPVIYSISPVALLSSYENNTANYPGMEQIFLDIANVHLGGRFNPVWQVVEHAFYLNYLENRGIDILSPLHQLWKYSRDIITQSGIVHIHVDIIMLHERLHAVEIVRDLCPNAQFRKVSSLKEGNVVFFGLRDGGGLLFSETSYSEFFKKLQDRGN